MATTLKPPTNLRGTVSDEAFGAILDDATADLPADLVWPLSIMTYATMRRDSTCDSILQGYTLQMRRATWQLSGRGCDPKVVARVGQDMDLQVVGTDATGGARVAGVSWPEHLRTALTSTLAYGHMGFELGVEIRDGEARLTTLAERLPQTISQIHADPKTGAFLGVTQDSPIAERSVPQIPARFMAWYCREREGISWQGASLFRSAWAPFLIKREMMRVLATSNRRFGMGVPTMEALPNANVTPEQMQAAQQLASAARVGEQGGAATPPNFTFKLVGLSGGVPDTLAFIRWLDSQITRAALMQHLELGQNNNGGARALGEAFIDSWTMALETLAEEAAVVATRQIAARLVGWNEGDQEAVPRVVVSGVGSKRDVTAESLHLLLQSGALAPDPALEAWIRREYRLPERDGMAQPGPSVKGDTVRDANQPKPADTPAPVAASRPRARQKRTQATGQGSLFAAADAEPARDLTDDEQASGADFEQIQADHDAAVATLVAALPALLAPIAAGLVAAVTAALAAGTLVALADLADDIAEITVFGKAIGKQSVKLAKLSARRAAREVKGVGLPVADVAVDEAGLLERGQATAHLIAQGMAQAAARTALLNAGPGVDPATVAGAVRADLDALVAGDRTWVVDSVSSAMWSAQDAGRQAAFEAVVAAYGDTAATWVASERLDKATCPACAEANGRRFETLTEARTLYPAGQNIACAGRSRCRGTLIVIPAK